jgi:membrane-bound lytic murein transglycosylase A
MRRAGRLVLLVLLALLLSACSAMDYVPWPSSGGGGRPAPARRNRVASVPSNGGWGEPEPTRPRLAEPQAAVKEGPPGYDAVAGPEAMRLAMRLNPTSQSLRSFGELAAPLRDCVAYLARKPQDGTAFEQDGGRLTYGLLRQSAEELLALLPGLDADPGRLADRFVWYELAPEPLVTGYYAPEVQASLTREAGFETPLYGRPADLRQATPEELRQGRPKAYRLADGAVLPYFDREAIDQQGALSGRGLEIAWVKSPLDAFMLQTEGAGVLVLPDGSRRAIQFAANNGHEFKGLGQLLLDSGALTRDRLGRDSIRAWCEANPERARAIMAENRSYVFFELGRGSQPGESLGALEKPLTPLVSLATDPSLLPLGAVAALDLSLPGAEGGPAQALRGIVLAQDTGADIRGSRLDLYLGGGERARRLESGLRTHAGLYLLISKNALRQASMRGQ